jgi:signal transduction histidine kinase
VGNSLFDLNLWHDTKDRDHLVSELNRYGMVENLEALFVGKNKQIKTGLVSARFLKIANQETILAIIRDITERKQLEEQLQQSQKMEAMGILAGGIAHDFNNILFSILGHSEMLLEKFQENDSTRQDIYQIYSGALRAMELVKQILSFSRRGKKKLALMQLQPIVKDVLKLIRSTIPATISINRHIQSDCGPVKADPTQIHQVIMNLATNAFHAMEKNGGTLTVTLKQVVWKEDGMTPPEMPSGVYACLTIADTGTGMNKTVREKMYDPFFTTKKKGKGTGMGLPVVYGIVKNMNGTIQVDSASGKGSSFHVYLPVASNAAADRSEPECDAPIPGGTEKILLVDDEETVITMEANLLRQLGYDVVSCTSSTEALKIFTRNPNAFDLIITDLAMPVLPGDRLAKELLKLRPDTPILLCTGFSEHLTEEKITAMGIRGFALKPILIRDLAEKIRNILNG